jgi:hypothetical protein
MTIIGSVTALTALAAAGPAAAKTVEVIGGETRVSLALEALAANGLELAGVTPAVDVGTDGSVGFAINAVSGTPPGVLPTTFAFDTDDPFNTLSGTIEHTGSVLFNDEGVIVGNFTIASEGGVDFSVTDNVGLGLTLFDAVASNVEVSPGKLLVEGDLFVSSAFADVLQAAGFTMNDLAGVDVGDFTTDAVVTPLPGAVVFAGTGLAALGALRARQRRYDG